MNAFLNRAVLSLVIAFLLSAQALAQGSTSTPADNSGKSQLKAIDRMGERHENAAAVVPQLQKMLMSDDPQVRWHSARALGDFGALASEAAPELVKMLSDKNPIAAYHAAIALGKIEDKSEATTDALVEAATSKDPRVARAAISALHHLKPGPEKVAAALKKALTSGDQAVTLHALEAIVEQGHKAGPLLKETLKQPETAYLACTAVEQIGPDAASTVPELTELLGKTKHSQLLIQTLLALASIGPAAQPAESAILPHLKTTTDDTVPVAAVYALGSIGAKDADDALKEALDKKDPFMHMMATWALAKLHPNDHEMLKSAVTELAKGLGNEKPQMRAAAAKGLQMLQAPPEMVAPSLIAIANDPDPEVSANVVGALAGLGESVIPRAIKALERPNARPLALRVLSKIGPKAASAVEPLVAAAKDADPEYRGKIFFTLAAIGPAASPATDILAASITNDDKRIRESALYALREIGPAANGAVRPLLQKMEADKSFDSLAAAWALARIAPTNEAVAKRVLPVLLRGLSSTDEQIRLNSVAALADMGMNAASAAGDLKKASREDKSDGVRDAAAAALKRVEGRNSN